MPTFKLVATDIDNTLIPVDGEPSARTLEVLRALRDREIPVVLVTGLNPWPIRRHLEAIGPDVRAIALNGIFLMEGDEVHAGDFLDPDVAREAAVHVAAQGYVPLVYGEDGVSRYLPTPRGLPYTMRRLIAGRPYQPYTAVNSFKALFDVRPAQLSVCDTEERADPLFPVLRDAFGDRAYVVYQPGERTWVEVNHPDARKDRALVKLAQRLDVVPEEIVYFGDGLNDLVVFERLPHTVAVANARPEVKALAWREAPPCEEDGVAETLAELFL